MKRTYLLLISSGIVLIIVIFLTLLQVRSVRSGPQASTPTPIYGSSQLNSHGTNVLPAMPTAVIPKITDLAPNIPYEDKPSVVVQHADGSRERYLLAPDAVDAFIKNLPEGDKFVVDVPPPSLLMTHEAP